MGVVFVAICIVDSCCHDQVQQHHWFPISHTMVAQVDIDRARAIVAKCIRAISDAEVVLCECKADKARAEAVLGELVAVQAQERVRVRLGLNQVVPAPRMASGGDVVVVTPEAKPTPKRSRRADVGAPAKRLRKLESAVDEVRPKYSRIPVGQSCTLCDSKHHGKGQPSLHWFNHEEIRVEIGTNTQARQPLKYQGLKGGFPWWMNLHGWTVQREGDIWSMRAPKRMGGWRVLEHEAVRPTPPLNVKWDETSHTQQCCGPFEHPAPHIFYEHEISQWQWVCLRPGRFNQHRCPACVWKKQYGRSE